MIAFNSYLLNKVRLHVTHRVTLYVTLYVTLLEKGSHAYPPHKHWGFQRYVRV